MTLLTREAAVTLRKLPATLSNRKRNAQQPVDPRQPVICPHFTQAIFADDVQIGHLIVYEVPGRPFCYLKQLNVDDRYHHMGFRRRAIEKLVDTIKGELEVQELVVTISPHRADQIHFFKGLGFYNSGEVVDGEYVFKLNLM